MDRRSLFSVLFGGATAAAIPLEPVAAELQTFTPEKDETLHALLERIAVAVEKIAADGEQLPDRIVERTFATKIDTSLGAITDNREIVSLLETT